MSLGAAILPAGDDCGRSPQACCAVRGLLSLAAARVAAAALTQKGTSCSLGYQKALLEAYDDFMFTIKAIKVRADFFHF